MRRCGAVAAVVLALAGAAMVVTAPVADAVSAPTAGWWSRLATADPASQLPVGLPAPAPTTPDTIPGGATAPPGQLLVEGAPDGATAIAAIRWELEPGESGPSLVLPVAPGSSVNPQSIVLACKTATPWTKPESAAGSWDDKPLVDGSRCVNGVLADDLSTIAFGIQPLVSGNTLDIVLTPGEDPAVEVPAGVPEAPADVDGSLFRLLFDPPGADALEVVAGDFTEGEGDRFVTPEPEPTPEFGTIESPSTDFTPSSDVTTPPFDAGADVAAPALDPEDLGPSVPDVASAVPAAASGGPVNRTIGFVLLAVAGLVGAWTYFTSPTAGGQTEIGLGRFRTTVSAAGAASSATVGVANAPPVVGGLSRFARPRHEPPPPLA